MLCLAYLIAKSRQNGEQNAAYNFCQKYHTENMYYFLLHDTQFFVSEIILHFTFSLVLLRCNFRILIVKLEYSDFPVVKLIP